MLLPLGGCAGPLAAREDRIVHQRRGWSVADPAAFAEAWRRVEVEGALAAYRGPGGASMTLTQACQRSEIPLPVLAREILLGLDAREVRSAGPVEVGGAPGYRQVARARLGDRTVDVKTVTRRVDGCSLDWILVAPDGLEGVEPLFDRWWASFRPADPAEGGGS